MTRFRVATPMGVTFPAGSVLELTADQAKRRHGQVERQKDGDYKVLSPVSFKNGELIGFSGDVPKSLEAVMEDPRTGESVSSGKAKKAAAAANKTADKGDKGGNADAGVEKK